MGDSSNFSRFNVFYSSDFSWFEMVNGSNLNPSVGFNISDCSLSIKDSRSIRCLSIVVGRPNYFDRKNYQCFVE